MPPSSYLGSHKWGEVLQLSAVRTLHKEVFLAAVTNRRNLELVLLRVFKEARVSPYKRLGSLSFQTQGFPRRGPLLWMGTSSGTNLGSACGRLYFPKLRGGFTGAAQVPAMTSSPVMPRRPKVFWLDIGALVIRIILGVYYSARA